MKQRFPQLMPQLPTLNLRGLTLFELYARHERNETNIELLTRWLIEMECPMTRQYLDEFIAYRKRLNRSIYLKELKIWLFSLVGR